MTRAISNFSTRHHLPCRWELVTAVSSSSSSAVLWRIIGHSVLAVCVYTLGRWVLCHCNIQTEDADTSFPSVMEIKTVAFCCNWPLCCSVGLSGSLKFQHIQLPSGFSESETWVFKMIAQWTSLFFQLHYLDLKNRNKSCGIFGHAFKVPQSSVNLLSICKPRTYLIWIIQVSLDGITRLFSHCRH